MDNVNDSFFDGHYKEIWKTIFPEKTTFFEVDFLSALVKQKPNSRILDLMCGNGRHSLELAKKGYAVTAIDNLQSYIDELNAEASLLGLNIDAKRQSVLRMQLQHDYDLAIIMGNSFQFFDQDQLTQILTKLNQHMVGGGYLVINTWMILEIAARNFQPSSNSKIMGYDMSVSSRWCFNPTRIETDCTIINDRGVKEEKKGVDFIYGLNEISAILQASGFKIEKLDSIPGKKNFEFGDPRIYITAVKL